MQREAANQVEIILNRIQEADCELSKYDLYGLSLLFVLYKDETSSEPPIKVYMIDFEKARLKDENAEDKDEVKTLEGMKNLRTFFMKTNVPDWKDKVLMQPRDVISCIRRVEDEYYPRKKYPWNKYPLLAKPPAGRLGAQPPAPAAALAA